MMFQNGWKIENLRSGPPVRLLRTASASISRQVSCGVCGGAPLHKIAWCFQNHYRLSVDRDHPDQTTNLEGYIDSDDLFFSDFSSGATTSKPTEFHPKPVASRSGSSKPSMSQKSTVTWAWPRPPAPWLGMDTAGLCWSLTIQKNGESGAKPTYRPRPFLFFQSPYQHH